MLSGEDITYPAGAQESTLVVFRLRDPALITNDNLESNMEQDSVDLSAESLTQAIGKIRTMQDIGLLSTNPSIVVGTMAEAAALAGLASNQATVTAATLKSHGKPVEIKPFEVNATMEMLEDASSPYNIDPETLSNLWVVRFGKGWVGNEAVENTDDDVDWWRHCANRLRELGYLEMHTLASSYRVVMRIVE